MVELPVKTHKEVPRFQKLRITKEEAIILKNNSPSKKSSKTNGNNEIAGIQRPQKIMLKGSKKES